MSDRLTDAYGTVRPEDVLPAGLPETRAAVARHTGVTDDEVAVTAGANLGLTCVMTLLRMKRKPRRVLIPRPHYPAYASISLFQEFQPEYYAMHRERGWQPDPDEVVAAVRQARPAAVIWNTPHNPTGAVIPAEATRRVVQAAAEVGALVVHDEVFADLVLDGETPPPPPVGPHVVRVGGFNKRFPGLADERVAYLLAPPKTALELALVHRTLAIGAGVRAQRAVVAALAADTAGEFERLRAELRAHRDYAVARLAACPGVRVEPPAAGLFVLFRLPDGFDPVAFGKALRDRTGLWCAAGPSFGLDGEPWLRLRYAVPFPVLRTHCDALTAAIRGRAPRLAGRA